MVLRRWKLIGQGDSKGSRKMLLWQKSSFSRTKESVHNCGVWGCWGNPSPPALITMLPNLQRTFYSLNLISPSQRPYDENISSFFRQENSFTERLYNWLKVTRLVRGRSRIWTQAPRVEELVVFPIIVHWTFSFATFWEELLQLKKISIPLCPWTCRGICNTFPGR